MAKTVSSGPPVMVRAIALLRVVILGLDGSRVTKVFRVRILRAGCSSWSGLLLGAPALDVDQLGLEHKPCVGDNFFRSLGIMSVRLEEAEVQHGLHGA